MPRIRHLRLAVLAVPVAALLLLSSGSPQTGMSDPVGVDVAAAQPAAARETRSVAPRSRPDPNGPHGELPAPRPPSLVALTGYAWPLPNARLTLPFEHSQWGSRLVDGRLFHDGVDLATFCGDRIYAAHDGVVLAAGRRYDDYMGWRGDLRPYYERLDEKKAWGSLPIVVVIDDGNGYRSIYAHFSQVVVKPGDQVRAGQLVGYEGATGRASGCHLHYGLFSPLEPAVFEIRPEVVKALLVPRFQTARVDPLLVLPRPVPVDPTQDGERPTSRPATTVPNPSPAVDGD